MGSLENLLMTDKRRIPLDILILIAILAQIGVNAISSDAAGEIPDRVPGEIIVKFSANDQNKIDSLLSLSGARSAHRVFPNTPQLFTVYMLRFPS